jgi:hypothetical protein
VASVMLQPLLCCDYELILIILQFLFQFHILMLSCNLLDKFSNYSFHMLISLTAFHCTYTHITPVYRDPNRAVNIATGHGLNNRGVTVRIPLGSRRVYPYVIHTSSVAHSSSYSLIHLLIL